MAGEIDRVRRERDRRKAEVAAMPVRRAIAVTGTPGRGAEERRARHARMLAAALNGLYDLGWVSPENVANLADVWVDERHEAIVLTLFSGTRIIDRADRIDVVGTVDDVAVSELVEAVRRRGWRAVQVRGDEAFCHDVARGLAGLQPPVRVAGPLRRITEQLIPEQPTTPIRSAGG